MEDFLRGGGVQSYPPPTYSELWLGEGRMGGGGGAEFLIIFAGRRYKFADVHLIRKILLLVVVDIQKITM